MTHDVNLTTSAAEFERRLRAIRPEQWDAPTPCGDWDVRELVRHVVKGNTMAANLLAGWTADQVRALFADPLSDDPIDEFLTGTKAQADALAEPGALERIVHHPAFDMPGAQLLNFRVGDLTLHAWDLARSIGADETLDPQLVQAVWDALAPMAPIIATTGVFGEGPSATVGEDAPLQLRLLDLTGRRP
jgi:uncharacterized protein (TIGR03086 family)